MKNTVRYAENYVEIGLTRDESNFYIRVWDDGPGIPARYIPYVFDRGWTPEVARPEEPTSSGLGLFTTQTLAQRYSGNLTAHSAQAPEPEHHATFLVPLPLREPPSHLDDPISPKRNHRKNALQTPTTQDKNTRLSKNCR